MSRCGWIFGGESSAGRPYPGHRQCADALGFADLRFHSEKAEDVYADVVSIVDKYMQLFEPLCDM